MNWFYDLKIAKKLLLSFSLVLILSAISGVFSVIALGKVNTASTELATNWLPTIRTLADIKLLLARVRSNEAQLALYHDDKDSTRILIKRTDMVITELNAAVRLYETQISQPEEKALYPEMHSKIAKLLSAHASIIAAIQGQGEAEAKKLFAGESSDIYFSLLEGIDKLTRVNQIGSDKSSQEADLTFERARLFIIVLLSGALTIGLVLAIFVARVISVPLKSAVTVAQQVAAGDLSTHINPSSKDETGELMLSLKKMNDSLHSIVSQVRNGTDTIATASSQIAIGNLDLSSRTEEQASSLEETASVMEEITATVKQNSDNARQANQLAKSASKIAVDGGKVVGQVVHTMSSINESSKQIVEIISVIDGIAFQTNILALNAAVEAARAGEQGRGFAVVATEVRSLAQRSSSAAKEIKALIDNSVAQVNEGSRLVETAGKTMGDVVASVQRVTDIVSEITAASVEQTQGIEEINRAISQMDEVTQQNAALVEEAAAAAQSLQNQAQSLSRVVSVFTLTSTRG
ncbi:methyl-accepting chemotaxis protein [Herbaspirillum camelliae]|uniref:methyl-accepting chemotaxis protein n=1 Tax=Herbaspirillum camelliae TaxID=1892903 RepID=UPI000949E1CA|nr:methyl-accepting chemotaxis protein [Herbaspirillum camelliae]